MPSNIFDYVNVGTKIYRSLYNLDYENIFDCDFGKGVPVMARFALPGDVWKITNVGFFRTLPLFAPIFTGIKVKFRNFFVPLRLVAEDAAEIISGGEDGNSTKTFDYFYNQPKKYGFHDYLGVPLNINPGNCGENMPRCYWSRAYNLIYNEWYRDEQLQDEKPVLGIYANNIDDLFNVNYSRDYFTSALLNQQLGVAPAVPLMGVLPIDYTGGVYHTDYDSVNRYYADVMPVLNQYDFGNPASQAGNGFKVYADSPLKVRSNQVSASDLSLSVSNSYVDPSVTSTSVNRDSDIVSPGPRLRTDSNGGNSGVLDNYSVNLSAAGGQFDIQDIRRAFAFQSILERNNRAGSRYNEFLRANYGISPTDETLQRPVYLGGSQSYINISEVLQNSQTTDSSPLGTQAGKGIGLSSNSIKPYLVKEFGLMFTIMSITPDTQYMSQGVNRQYTYGSRWDFFNPSLQNLGEQAIRNGELFISDDSSDNDKIFGYQPMYQELRFNDNIICGSFRDNLKYWHLGREFSERPNLDSDFIEVDSERDNLNRIFAADSSSQYKPFYCHIYNKLRVVRPLVKYPIPATL